MSQAGNWYILDVTYNAAVKHRPFPPPPDDNNEFFR
jgi:hypothetical protein